MIPWLFLVLIVAAAAGTGFRGLDLGQHWDEPKTIAAVTRSVETGLLLPRLYVYPSVIYDLALLALLPEVTIGKPGLRRVVDAMLSVQDNFTLKQPGTATERADSPTFSGLASFTTSQRYLLRVRGLFLSVTLLTLVWSYLLLLVWGRGKAEALLGTALLGSSWEVAYHARWIAADAILMQFGVLTLLVLFLAIKRRSHRLLWLRAGAFIAGLGCSTKYPGGLLLLPVLLTCLHLRREQAATDERGHQGGTVRRLEYFYLSALFCISFLVSTPGAVLEPVKFVGDVLYEIRIYSTGFGPHTVSRGPEHLICLGKYLSLVVLSHFRPVALCLFLLALVGGWTMFRRERSVTLIFLSLPVAYALYMGSQKVMIARNYLILVPFLTVLVARGAAWLVRRSPRRYCGWALMCLITAAVLVNFAWLCKAAESIAQRHTLDHRQNVLAFLMTHEGQRVYLSTGVKQLVGHVETTGGINVVPTPDRAEVVLALSTELKRRIANTPHSYQVVSGSWEVNFDYYPEWGGDRRVIALSRETMDRIRLRRMPME